MRSPYVEPRAFVITIVVSATRTSSVFDETMQAFFVKSTFPIGEGYFRVVALSPTTQYLVTEQLPYAKPKRFAACYSSGSGLDDAILS